MRMLLVLGICLLGSVAARADGFFLDGTALWDKCTGSGESVGECSGYVMAVADAMTLDGATKKECLAKFPTWLIAAQTQSIVVEYMRANHDSWKQPAIAVVRTALVQAFPCQ